jgi:hypothetical protein
MARRSRPSQRSAVLGAVKDEPPYGGGLKAILDGSLRAALPRGLRSGRRNGVAVEQRNGTLKKE